MSAKTKRSMTWIAIVLVVFFVVSQPQQSAGVVRDAVGLLQQAAQALITFLQSLA